MTHLNDAYSKPKQSDSESEPDPLHYHHPLCLYIHNRHALFEEMIINLTQIPLNGITMQSCKGFSWSERLRVLSHYSG